MSKVPRCNCGCPQPYHVDQEENDPQQSGVALTVAGWLAELGHHQVARKHFEANHADDQYQASNEGRGESQEPRVSPSRQPGHTGNLSSEGRHAARLRMVMVVAVLCLVSYPQGHGLTVRRPPSMPRVHEGRCSESLAPQMGAPSTFLITSSGRHLREYQSMRVFAGARDPARTHPGLTSSTTSMDAALRERCGTFVSPRFLSRLGLHASATKAGSAPASQPHVTAGEVLHGRVPRRRGAEGLQVAGRRHQRQAHRDHRAADDEEGRQPLFVFVHAD